MLYSQAAILNNAIHEKQKTKTNKQTTLRKTQKITAKKYGI